MDGQTWLPSALREDLCFPALDSQTMDFVSDAALNARDVNDVDAHGHMYPSPGSYDNADFAVDANQSPILTYGSRSTVSHNSPSDADFASLLDAFTYHGSENELGPPQMHTRATGFGVMDSLNYDAYGPATEYRLPEGSPSQHRAQPSRRLSKGAQHLSSSGSYPFKPSLPMDASFSDAHQLGLSYPEPAQGRRVSHRELRPNHHPRPSMDSDATIVMAPQHYQMPLASHMPLSGTPLPTARAYSGPFPGGEYIMYGQDYGRCQIASDLEPEYVFARGPSAPMLQSNYYTSTSHACNPASLSGRYPSIQPLPQKSEPRLPEHSNDLDEPGDPDENKYRTHELYNAKPGPDGLYHCPFRSTEKCQHGPHKLKCSYDKSIDSHIKPFTCAVPQCSTLTFSSMACKLRHQRENHGMHGHGDRPFLCEYPGCDRARPGYGFPRKYNAHDHMKRVHAHTVGLSRTSSTMGRSDAAANVGGGDRRKTRERAKKSKVVAPQQQYGGGGGVAAGETVRPRRVSHRSALPEDWMEGEIPYYSMGPRMR